MTCKVLSIDHGKKRISLSIKALVEAPARPEPQASGGASGRSKGEDGFAAAFGRRGGRGRDDAPVADRPEDAALRRLRAAWGSDKELKGGIS